MRKKLHSALTQHKKIGVAVQRSQYLSAVLSHTGQNLKKACDISGISKSGMYSKLKKYALN